MRTIIFPILCVLVCFACSDDSNTPDQSESIPKTDSSEVAEMESTGKVTKEKRILFFGNSLTAGYGLDTESAFPEIIQQKIDSFGLSYKVINSGVSGETSSDGKSRIDWVLREEIDVFVLELGANDGLRGIPASVTRENLQYIIERVKSHYPEARILLTGMEVPPNMGPDYAQQFREVFKDIAQTNQLAFVPFLLEGVAGEPELNQGDRIHPTAEGHRIVAENVWKELRKIL